MLNVALRHPTKPENENADEWNNDTDVEDIVAMIERYHPALAEMFRLAESVSVHKVFRRDPLQTYTRGRGVIIGDAAHPIQPTHGKSSHLIHLSFTNTQ
jgi:salicylate hydroxylase